MMAVIWINVKRSAFKYYREEEEHFHYWASVPSSQSIALTLLYSRQPWLKQDQAHTHPNTHTNCCETNIATSLADCYQSSKMMPSFSHTEQTILQMMEKSSRSSSSLKLAKAFSRNSKNSRSFKLLHWPQIFPQRDNVYISHSSAGNLFCAPMW